MDVRQLRCFIAVAEELHFGRAAERLGVAPPALSRQISALEDELGVSLLTRTTRQVAMTRAGLIMLEEAKAILVKMEHSSRAVREASLASGKVLRVGAIDAASSSFLPEALVTFRARFPGIEIKFVEAMTAGLVQMLESGVRAFSSWRSGGTGLGLLMVRRFAHDLGGSLRLENRAPHGARLTIELPCGTSGHVADAADH